MAGTDFSHLTNDELIKGIKALDLPDYIRSKAYGIDVRETLAQMTEMTIQLGVNMGLSPDEALKWARKLQESVSQSEFDSWVATLLDGGPSIFMNTLSELQSTYPNGAPGVALVRETDPAKIYVWNGSSWEDFGDYQGITVSDGSVSFESLDDELQSTLTKEFLANDDYDFSSYQVVIKNKTDVSYSNEPIKIYASFSNGECKNEESIVVLDESDNVVPHQWEDDRDVNLKYDKNHGRYYDGSLKNGYIWITDSITASSSKVYTVRIYPKEVNTNLTPIINSTVNENGYVFSSVNLEAHFLKNSKYILDGITVNSTGTDFKQRPAIKGVGITYYLTNVLESVSVVSTKITGSGVVYKEFEVVNRFLDWLDVKINTRFYVNGLIKQDVTFNTLKSFTQGTLLGLHNRLAIKPNATVDKSSTDLTFASWASGSKTKFILASNTHGDIPRGAGGGVQNIPAFSQLTTGSPSAGFEEILTGWNTSGSHTYTIESGTVFYSTILANLSGVTGSNEEIKKRAMNILNGRLTSQTETELKTEILDMTAKQIRHLYNDFTSKVNASNISAFNPPVGAKLALLKYYGIGDLDSISSDYKSIILNLYGDVTPENLWALRQSDGFSLDTAGRVFPIALTLLDLFTESNDAEEITYYKNIIESYADMLSKSFEQSGYVGLLLENGYNSNSTAMGLRGLSIGMRVFGVDYSEGRWNTAYNAILTAFNDFIKIGNFAVDWNTYNLSTNHYISYAAFTNYEFARACENLQSAPFYDVTAYPILTSSAYGSIQEQKYCISSSRRGLALTSAYVIYLSISKGTVSDLAQSKSILNRLDEQNYPAGGQQFPLENWWNPSSGYDSNASITMQVLSDLVLKLIDENIKPIF